MYTDKRAIQSWRRHVAISMRPTSINFCALGLSISLVLLHTYFFDGVDSGLDTHWPSLEAQTQQDFYRRAMYLPIGAILLREVKWEAKHPGAHNCSHRLWTRVITRTSDSIIQHSRVLFVGIGAIEVRQTFFAIGYC